MKELTSWVLLAIFSIFLCGGVPSIVKADTVVKFKQSSIQVLTPFKVAPDGQSYVYFMRGLAPEADNVSNNGNITTRTSLITFDIMQLSSYDRVLLKDMSGNILSEQFLTNQLSLNRITFSNLQGKFKAGQVYSVRVASSEFRELPIFFILPVEEKLI